MICRLTGRVSGVAEESIVIEREGIGYEVMVPASAAADLRRLVGNELTLFTVQYFEGNPAGAHLVPRLIGFLSETDREFFSAFTRVRGISYRRALRAMSYPAHQLAAAIEQGDVRLLTSLPEIGKKTAAQIIADLQGKLLGFLQPTAAPLPAAEMTDAQRVAVDILVRWGDRRADAQRWVAVAVEADPSLKEPDAIVRAAYRAKELRIASSE
jgi:Holliday junction DNA helicase RuvA